MNTSRNSSFVFLYRNSIWTRCLFCQRRSILTSFRSEPGNGRRSPGSPLHVPCQGPGRGVLCRQIHNDSASPKEPFKTSGDIVWISGWYSRKPVYFCGLFRQSMLSRISYNFSVVGKYFFVDALNRNLSLHSYTPQDIIADTNCNCYLKFKYLTNKM